ncbi:hypothetical protein GGR52DRAFT_237488 [Hypoxylon sp. FL1284]|nr:hypothetical protein GGR52DRAFT_237488 [Hypoxylon sp. FL1284]
MPPNSFCEWVVGQNLPRNRAPKKPRPVFSLALETDDEAEKDTLRLTYPRTGRHRQAGRAGRAGRGRATDDRKVQFKESVQTPATKHANSRRALSLDTEVSSEPETSPGESTTDDGLILDCPCTDCVSARRRLRKLKRGKARTKNYQTDSSEDDSRDDPASVHARHKAKKAKEAESIKSKGNRSGKNSKSKKRPQAKRGKEKPESEAESTDAAEVGTDTDTKVETDAGTTEAETTGVETEAESEKEVPKAKPKKKSKEKQSSAVVSQSKKGKKGKQVSQDQQTDSDAQQEENSKAPDKVVTSLYHHGGTPNKTPRAGKVKARSRSKPRSRSKTRPRSHAPPNPPPELRQGNFFFSPSPRVVQVEHAVEVQDDPRPNAYFDNAAGVMRVYHGAAYGNPYGSLYNSRVYGTQNLPLPVGSPHPAQNPWHNGLSAQSAPPQTKSVSATASEAPGAGKWLQGYGKVTIGQSPEEVQKSGPATRSDQKPDEGSTKRQSSPPSGSPKGQKNGDASGESNVLPSIEVASPDKAQNGNANGNGSKRGDIQSVHGSPTSSTVKEERNNGKKKSKASSPDKEKTASALSAFDDIMEKDKAAAEKRDERWTNSDKSGSKEPSPAPQNDIPDIVDISLQAENFWGPQENSQDMADVNPETFWGDAPAEETDAGGPKGNDGTSEENGRNSPGANADAPGSNRSSPKPTSNGDDPNNVTGGNESSNGDEKKPSEDVPGDDPTQRYVPGGWVSPTKSQFSRSGKSRHTSPDNVGVHYSGSNNGSPGKSASGGGDSPGKNGSGNGNGGWQDPNVAQSSGGAFDNDDKEPEITYTIESVGLNENEVDW